MNEVTIIGTGPAGLTAAIYAARAALEPVIYTGEMPGGQLTTTTDVENFPGFREGIMGPKLMEDMAEQAKRVGAKVVVGNVTKVDLKTKPITLWVDDEEVKTKTLIISTGATAKTLGLKGEAELMGRGLSTCATCDGFFYKNKKVIVVGGGDSAMEEATYLAKMCSEVILVHRRDYFRASPIMLERAQKNDKIKFLVPFGVEEMHSNEMGFTGATLKNSETGETQKIEADGLFMAIGHKPNSDLFEGQLDLDEAGYIKTTHETATAVPGVYSAGDISDSEFRQAVTAAGMGCKAAMQAQRYLEEHE